MLYTDINLPELGPYVYFQTLISEHSNNPIFNAYGQKVQNYSTFNPHFDINLKQEGIYPIQSAISELKNIAATQTQIEHRVIHNYLVRINNHLKNTKLPDDLKRNLRAQRDKIQNLDFSNYKTDQLNLIQAINGTIQNLKAYERRLKEIQIPIVNHSDFESRLDFDIQSRLERFLERQVKTTSGKLINRDKELSRQMEKQFTTAFSGFPSNLSNELKSLLFIDFNYWLENNSDRSYNNLTESDITQLFEEYAQLQNEELSQTHLQRLLNTSTDKIKELLSDMKSILHSDYLTKAQKIELEQLVTDAEQRKKTEITFKKEKLTLTQAKKLLKTYDYNLSSKKGHYVFTLHTRTSHGNFFEEVKKIIQSATNIKGNVASDVIIPIGMATFTTNEQLEQQALTQLGDDIGDLLTKDFNKKKTITIENFKESIIHEQELSTEIQNYIQQTESDLDNLKQNNEQFFIAHESTKLYKSVESEHSQIEDFHGREMNALSALTKLYSATNLSTAMIDPEILITYLLNIDPVTLAGNLNRDPLQTYLSLFAGLLMFDDVKALAESGIKSIQANLATSTINCVHVYDINGIYYPVSIILNNLIMQMEQILDTMTISNNYTATVEIKQKTPVEPENYSLDQWPIVANDTISNTTLQIHFLAGFTDYVKSIFKNFNS